MSDTNEKSSRFYEVDKAQVRMQCLDYALRHFTGRAAVEVAREYADFVRGTNDAEVLAAARKLADVASK